MKIHDGPKLQFLQSRGASSTELTEIVSTVPKFVGKKDGNCRVSANLSADTMISSKSLYKWIRVPKLGMPQKLLFPLLISDSGPLCVKEKFEESLKKVVEIGFDPTTSKFVKPLHVFYQMSDKTIEEKVRLCCGRCTGNLQEVALLFEILRGKDNSDDSNLEDMWFERKRSPSSVEEVSAFHTYLVRIESMIKIGSSSFVSFH
ncbi:unnamed protein product [Arabidopsis thaliana]|uniref:Uncharacterized protein n=1 Tax=Arabidopsis thaliana TaxID=3702 RepID=A0A654ELS5_ARATH|nr:unnamed protein product [Arabidopsis thaliana]